MLQFAAESLGPARGEYRAGGDDLLTSQWHTLVRRIIRRRINDLNGRLPAIFLGGCFPYGRNVHAIRAVARGERLITHFGKGNL